MKWIVRVGVYILGLAATLFISVGSLDWVMAWVYVGVFVVSQVITALILIPSNPTLIAERAHMHEGSKDWDKVLATLSLCGPLAIAIVAGLDVRFGWSLPTPLMSQMATLAMVILGHALVIWAMVSNRFFSTFVRIQKDRGHIVATAGPYQYVRHPGYVGAILLYLATPIVLGSLWGLIPAAIIVGLVVIRTTLEDRTLQAELTGYTDYARQVRYRLLPGVW